ncbi:MAG: dihydrofolate reductase [Oscillospiraceae bacterium]|nr:dihydrofolate reductase [Oscillospiraceae bacterium]
MQAIVAVDESWGIGYNNNLLFSIPEDIRYFTDFTRHKVVVMGRRTLNSLPGSKPLKDRINIVMSNDKSFKTDSATVCFSVERLFYEIKDYNPNDVIVIGGQTVYEQLIDYCSAAHVTKVKKTGKADRFFPNIDLLENWKVKSVSEEKEYNNIKYAFYVYCNENTKQPDLTTEVS